MYGQFKEYYSISYGIFQERKSSCKWYLEKLRLIEGWYQFGSTSWKWTKATDKIIFLMKTFRGLALGNFSQSFIIGRKNGLQGSESLSPHGVLKTNGFSIFRQIEPFGFKNAPWRNEMNAAASQKLSLSLPPLESRNSLQESHHHNYKWRNNQTWCIWNSLMTLKFSFKSSKISVRMIQTQNLVSSLEIKTKKMYQKLC